MFKRSNDISCDLLFMVVDVFILFGSIVILAVRG
jgi:hypothetical protein